jgi:hypothetical protein
MWVDVQLTGEVLDAVGETFAVDISAAPERLHGGEESARRSGYDGTWETATRFPSGSR